MSSSNASKEVSIKGRFSVTRRGPGAFRTGGTRLGLSGEIMKAYMELYPRLQSLRGVGLDKKTIPW